MNGYSACTHPNKTYATQQCILLLMLLSSMGNLATPKTQDLFTTLHNIFRNLDKPQADALITLSNTILSKLKARDRKRALNILLHNIGPWIHASNPITTNWQIDTLDEQLRTFSDHLPAHTQNQFLENLDTIISNWHQQIKNNQK